MSFKEFHELLSSERIELISSEAPAAIRANTKGKSDFIRYLLQRSLSPALLENKELQSHEEEIWQILEEREKSMSTGVGLGIAIPHCSSKFMEDSLVYMAVLEDGIEFDAIDDKKVHIVVLVLFPKEKFDKHIHLLSSIAKLLNGEEVRKKILAAKQSSEISDLIQELSS